MISITDDLSKPDSLLHGGVPGGGMSTLADDLAAAQANDSPSVAAAVQAAIDKEGPQPVAEIEQPLPEEDPPQKGPDQA